MRKYLIGLAVGFVLGSALIGVGAIVQTDCTTSSSYACIRLTHSGSGYTLILPGASTGNPTLKLPTTSGDLVTRQEVQAMIGAVPSPTPIPAPTPFNYTISGTVSLYTNSSFGNSIVELLDANGVFLSRTQANANGAFIFSVTGGRTYQVRLGQSGWAGAPKQYTVINASGRAVTGINLTAYNPNYCPAACQTVTTIP